MSNFDSAFIKAYGKNDPNHAQEDILRGPTRREEPIGDQLPNAGKAPSLSELVPGVTTTRPRVRRIDTRSATRPPIRETVGETMNRQVEEPAHAPRLASHTILDEEEDAAPQQVTRKAPLSAFKRAEQHRARLHVESDIESENELLDEALAEAAPVETSPEAVETPSPWKFEPIATVRPQPAFQIEQFFWPSVVESLAAESKVGFELLCEQLISGSRSGRKLLGVAGSRAQAGATTVLLALASQLSTHGVRVAIIDADIEHPELAHQLGVLPQFTWQDVVQQSLPLGEDWVESTRDQVTLSSLLKPIRKLDEALSTGLRGLMDQTREAFDLTLVDLGQFARAVELGVLSAVRPEGVIVVSDSRQRSRMSQAELEQALRSHGIHWWGIAENFNS